VTRLPDVLDVSHELKTPGEIRPRSTTVITLSATFANIRFGAVKGQVVGYGRKPVVRSARCWRADAGTTRGDPALAGWFPRDARALCPHGGLRLRRWRRCHSVFLLMRGTTGMNNVATGES